MVLSYISMTVLLITGILMIIVILLQRGRGGGLAGAFGGLGGQSALGTKAGDVFTKITVGLAVFWVVLAGLSGLALERDANSRFPADSGPPAISSPGDEAPAGTTPGAGTGGEAGSGLSVEENPFDSAKKPAEKSSEGTAPETSGTPADSTGGDGADESASGTTNPDAGSDGGDAPAEK